MTEAALMEMVPDLSPSPLVCVSFQRNNQRKLKFLEGEPKALGITQICMAIFHISCIGVFYASGLIKTGLEIPSFFFSVLVFIAGSVAIAAKNLKLPTLRACLGMEVVAGVASVVNLTFTTIKILDNRIHCYGLSEELKELCYSTESAHAHLFAELVVVHVALFAISVTLVIYAGKVINCCSPAPKVPVITIQAPPAPQ